MLICNCSMAGTDACRYCSNYKEEPMVSYTYMVYDFGKGEWYNPDRYELVEKKDWKINQLKERIKSYKEGIEEYNEKEAYYSKCISNFMEEVNKLEKELKGLETQPT